MKTFIKSLIVAIASVGMAFGSVAIAAELNGFSNDLDVLHVTTTRSSNASWSKNATVRPNDIVSFNIYYHVTSQDDANDVRTKITNLTNGTYTGSRSVTGQVTASNASSVSGSVNLNMPEEVSFTLHKVMWQPNKCKVLSCARQVLNAPSNVVGSGASIGTIQGIAGLDSSNNFNYQGNVVVEFKANAVNNPPVAQDPTVTTRSETNVDEDSAVLRGSFDLGDENDGDVYFIYGTSSSNLNERTSDQRRTSDGNFDQRITGLDDNRTYYYRAVLDTDGDVITGGLEQFRTESDNDNNGNDDEAEVETVRETNVDDDSAVLRGSVQEGGNVDVYFVISSSDSTPECKNTNDRIVNVSGDADENDSFSRTATNLNENTRYYYRACGVGQDGETVSGDVEEFVTEEEDNNNGDEEAEVDTKSETNVDEDSAVLRGDVSEGDNVDVFFVISSSDSTPECKNSNDRIVNVSGDVDENDSFSRTATGLSENTRYYYRACGVGEDGETVSGDVEEFVTEEDDDNNNTVSSNDSSAVTRIPSGVTTNSATLRSFVQGEGSGTCYFQYGTTTSLGLTTPSQSVNLDNTSSCTSTRFNLRPNTTYYYRAALVDGGETNFGLLQSFRTGSVPTVTPRPPVVTPRVPSTPTPVDNTVRVTVVEEVEQVTRGGLELTKFVSSFDDPRFSDETTADRDEAVFYKVLVRNNTTDVIEDLTVVDYIPFSLELDGQESLDDDSEKEVRWRIARLQPGDSREFTTEMRVRDDARYGSDIDSFATAFNDDISVNSNEVVIEVEQDEDEVVASDNGAQAASIFGAGFLPTSLAGWLVLVGIVLAIAYLISRILFSRNENERVLAELRAMQQSK